MCLIPLVFLISLLSYIVSTWTTNCRIRACRYGAGPCSPKNPEYILALSIGRTNAQNDSRAAGGSLMATASSICCGLPSSFSGLIVKSSYFQPHLFLPFFTHPNTIVLCLLVQILASRNHPFILSKFCLEAAPADDGA